MLVSTSTRDFSEYRCKDFDFFILDQISTVKTRTETLATTTLQGSSSQESHRHLRMMNTRGLINPEPQTQNPHHNLGQPKKRKYNGDSRYSRWAVPGALGAGVGAAAEAATSLTMFMILKPEL